MASDTVVVEVKVCPKGTIEEKATYLGLIFVARMTFGTSSSYFVIDEVGQDVKKDSDVQLFPW